MRWMCGQELTVSKEGRTEPNPEGVIHIGSEGRW